MGSCGALCSISEHSALLCFVGELHGDGSYSIMGNGILQMTEVDDVLRVDGDFTTESTLSHATMLTNGRMELGGNFNQSGNAASFGSSGNFTIAFIGSGEHKAHFDNVEYSQFANIDVAHANVVMDDETIVAMGRMLFAIGKGFISGLQEALGTEGLNAQTAAFTSAFGIAISVGVAVAPAMTAAIIPIIMSLLSVISASFMAAQAVEGIYSTATGTGTSYQRAEAYAHDAALLLMSIKDLVDAKKNILNDLKHLGSILDDLKGRQTRIVADELVYPTETKAFKKLYSFDDFVDCMQGCLDTESLQYIQQNLKEDNLSILNKVAEVVQSAEEVKSGPLELHEAKFIISALTDKNTADAKDDILEVIRYLNHTSDSDLINQEALEYLVKDIAKPGGHDLLKIFKSIKEASNAKKASLDKKDIKYLVRAVFDEVPQDQINGMIRDGAEEHFIIFNETHKDSLPKHKKSDTMGGKLESHHPLQDKWAKENLKDYDYKRDLAPTITLDTGKGYPHTEISNLQKARRRQRIAEGKGAWDSTLQEELTYIVEDLHTVGFSEKTIGKVMEQQYKFLDTLGVSYEKVNIPDILRRMRK